MNQSAQSVREENREGMFEIENAANYSQTK